MANGNELGWSRSAGLGGRKDSIRTVVHWKGGGANPHRAIVKVGAVMVGDRSAMSEVAQKSLGGVMWDHWNTPRVRPVDVDCIERQLPPLTLDI